MAEKKGLKRLPTADFVKMMGARLLAVARSTDAPPKELYAYKANRLAAQLHPKAQRLVVTQIVEHGPDVKSYLLAPDAENGTRALAWFSAGQYLCIHLEIGGASLNRPYSIASSPRETLEGRYNITVKRVDGGLASNYILDNWQVGTKVTASAPLGDFTYCALRDAPTVIGIAGGSGITPFRAFARAIAEGDEDFRLVLLYGSRTLADAVFGDELRELAAACGKITVVNVLSEEKAEGCEHGFITADLIRKYAPENEPYSIFLCGPQAMYNFADKEIGTLGLRRKFVRHELFGEVFHPENNTDYPGAAAGSFRVTVRMAGTEQTIDCPADTSLLRAMEAAGISAPSDCRSGRCGWCHSQLLSGEVYIPQSVDGRRLADRKYGYIHPCCAFPLSDVVIDVPPMGC